MFLVIYLPFVCTEKEKFPIPLQIKIILRLTYLIITRLRHVNITRSLLYFISKNITIL